MPTADSFLFLDSFAIRTDRLPKEIQEGLAFLEAHQMAEHPVDKHLAQEHLEEEAFAEALDRLYQLPGEGRFPLREILPRMRAKRKDAEKSWGYLYYEEFASLPVPLALWEALPLPLYETVDWATDPAPPVGPQELRLLDKKLLHALLAFLKQQDALADFLYPEAQSPAKPSSSLEKTLDFQLTHLIDRLSLALSASHV